MAVLALAGVALWGSGEWAARRASVDVHASAVHRLEVYSASLHNAIEKFAYLPFTVSQNHELARLVQHSADEALRARLNDYLERVNNQAGATVLYVQRADGLTVASSNWNTPQTYVGLNFGFRPYFTDAMQGKQGRFYAVGSSTRLPGYFISAPLRDERDQVVGVVVVKVSLDALEQSWKEADDRVMVTDRFGIVFLSSEPAWKFRALAPVSSEVLNYVEATRQYDRDHFDVLSLSARDMPSVEGRVVHVSGDPLGEPDGRDDLVVGRDVPPLGWRLRLLADAQPILDAARTARIGVLLLLIILAVVGLYLQQTRRRVREKRAAQAALARAHQELERKVVERTADLMSANRALETEVEQRIRTEQELRGAQSELVQAAKMAVLGQMAAGVTHELNQPLTAMRSLADNASTLLANGRADRATDNLRLISQLVDRMGRITQQLRNFSRRSPERPQAVDLAAVVDDASALLEQRLRQQKVDLRVHGVDGVWVLFEAVRLQQVLVNLLRNALDALVGIVAPVIVVQVERSSEQVLLLVRDNGPGMDAEVLRHLFDPFFTTKPAGEGLGLGLAVSMAIARDYGATLAAANHPDGGAVLTLCMQVSPPQVTRPTVAQPEAAHG